MPVENGAEVIVLVAWRLAAEGERGQAFERLAALSKPPRLINLVTARVDLRNTGLDTNAVRVLELSDAAARESDMGWCSTGGHGRAVESAEGELSLRVRCEGKGILELALRGRNVPDGAGGRESVWVDYTSLRVNGEELLAAPAAVWHDQPRKFTLPVEDGEVVEVSAAWRPHVEAERDAALARAERLSSKVASYRASPSWKIGRAITWLPRKLRALAKRLFPRG